MAMITEIIIMIFAQRVGYCGLLVSGGPVEAANPEFTNVPGVAGVRRNAPAGTVIYEAKARDTQDGDIIIGYEDRNDDPYFQVQYDFFSECLNLD